jgi:hypothetical protein
MQPRCSSVIIRADGVAADVAAGGGDIYPGVCRSLALGTVA